MAYTGVDALMNQRICMAWSNNLVNWGPVLGNPQVEPDPALFRYVTAEGWAVCRDPYLYRADDLWHLLATAQSAAPGNPGALLHATSADLFSWGEPELFMVNDGAYPDRVLESSTYLERDGTHHLFFHESGLLGIRHLFSASPDAWTMANGENIGQGVAPEIDTFDGGQTYVISRLGQYQDRPGADVVHFVARFDTLVFEPGQDHPDIQVTSALAREFALYTGDSVYGNPVLGDNPARRGETSVGLVGNGYFGSAEFFQGPLAYGIGGGMLGDDAVARLESHPFVIEGNSMSLLIGGTASPDLYVALMDAEADTILRQSFAEDNATMERDYWDIQYLQGLEALHPDLRCRHQRPPQRGRHRRVLRPVAAGRGAGGRCRQAGRPGAPAQPVQPPDRAAVHALGRRPLPGTHPRPARPAGLGLGRCGPAGSAATR